MQLSVIIIMRENMAHKIVLNGTFYDTIYDTMIAFVTLNREITFREKTVQIIKVNNKSQL